MIRLKMEFLVQETMMPVYMLLKIGLLLTRSARAREWT